MIAIKNLLVLSARQNKLCNHLNEKRNNLFRMAYAWSHHADNANEIVQETMIKAINSVDKIKDTGAIDSWLFRILSNCYIDFYRRQRKDADIDDIILIDNNTPESMHIQNEMLSHVRQAVSQLPFIHRQVITLVDLEEFSYTDVAEILDIPQGTVMSRLNRARQALKRKLTEQNTAQKNRPDLKVVK